jgi:hypothetical protein
MHMKSLDNYRPRDLPARASSLPDWPSTCLHRPLAHAGSMRTVAEIFAKRQGRAKAEPRPSQGRAKVEING